MSIEESEAILLQIDEAFGFTKHDFDKDGHLIYTKWGTPEDYTDVASLGHRSLKISKNLGNIYIDKISTDGWVLVGKGTTLHCDDITAGQEVVRDFEGFLM